MPLYEYECDACGKRFELIRRFSDPEVDVCTVCGKGPVRRLQSSPAIQFKGTGWYITDYARKGTAEKSSGEKTGGGKAEGGEKKTEGGEKKTEGGEKKTEGGEKKAEGGDKSDAAPPSTSSSSNEPKS